MTFNQTSTDSFEPSLQSADQEMLMLAERTARLEETASLRRRLAKIQSPNDGSPETAEEITEIIRELARYRKGLAKYILRNPQCRL